MKNYRDFIGLIKFKLQILCAALLYLPPSWQAIFREYSQSVPSALQYSKHPGNTKGTF